MPKLPTLPQLLTLLGANSLVVLLPTILAIVAIGIFVFRILKKGRQKNPAAASAAAPAATVEEDQVVQVEIVPPAALPAPRQIRMTVARAFRTLKDRISDRALRYRTPWFLVLGAEGSGKTTVLRQLMPEAVSPTDPTRAIGSRWHFFDRAVAIEVDGRLLRSESQPEQSEEAWIALHRALRFFRPERPIDGIVLTIPASDLYGFKRLDAEQLTNRARAIFRRLQSAQKVIGVRVPLYVLVTKCDLVQGFQDLASAVPLEKRGETFGWSNPYALESTFVPEYIDEAFDSLSADLFEVQMELLAKSAPADADGLFQFSGSFRMLQAPLRTFTTELCRESAYQESFFFRGLYFTGDGSVDAAERLVDAAYHDPDRYQAAEGSVLPPLPATLAVNREPYFLNDLFNEKVFGEAGLARSVSGSRLSRNRAILAIQAAILAIVVIGGLGIWRATMAIERESGLLITTLEGIESDLLFLEQSEASTQAGLGSASGTAMNSRVFPMLSSMGRVTGSVSSIFLPSSWVSPLHWEISESMRQGFVRVILPSMHASLLAKADSIVAPPILTDLSQTTIDGGELPRYLSAVGRLGRAVEQYDTVSYIGGRRELQSLVQLVKYLYDEDLPEEFDEGARYYRRALDESYGSRLAQRDRPTFAANVVDRSESLLRNYYDALIFRLEDIQFRFRSAESMQRLTAADLDDFRQLRSELTEVARVLNGSEPFWFDETQGIGPVIVETLDSIPATVLTPAEDIRTGFNDMFYRVRREKLDELNYRLDPYQTGEGGVTTGAESTMSLSPRLANLQMSLDTLFSQPFIATPPPTPRRAPVPPGGRIRWDVAGLDRALQEYAQYAAFLESRQNADNPGMNRLMQGLATVQLEARLRAAVQASMVPEAAGFAYGLRDRERDLRSRVVSFQEPSTRLLEIISRTESLEMMAAYEEFSAMYIDQSLGLLAEVDALLEEGGAYRPLGGTLANWDGRQPPIFPAFRARDGEELDRYLEQQRNRVRYLIDNFAAPLLGGLTSDPISAALGGAGSPASNLVSKWGGLVDELDRYESQSGSSSVGVLEQFIREEMSAADVATCVANSGRRASTGGDYFLTARNRLRSELYSRCEQLAVASAQEAYTQLERFFNANLAGRYPFSRDQGAPGQEADLESIRQFYALYDGLGAFRSAVGGQGATFIERMGEVRNFLRPLLDEEAEGGPSYNVSVDFRTNREEEQGADQIVGWTLGLGGSSVSYRGQTDQQSSVWRPGAPASLSLRWALQSTERPTGGDRYASASVNDREALFRYAGRWGLLRLVQAHVAATRGSQGYLLRFEVPTVRLVGAAGSTPGGRAQLFVQLRLTDPQGAAVGALPIFPAQAPAYR